jgi:hypothetical protein
MKKFMETIKLKKMTIDVLTEALARAQEEFLKEAQSACMYIEDDGLECDHRELRKQNRRNQWLL